MAASGEATQKALQSVAQSTRWTYSILWQLCPQQSALAWAEGHYNGAIKTRKTVQPGGEDEEEEATAAGAGKVVRRRSRQLRELYDSLAGEAAAAGGGGGGGRVDVHHGAQAVAARRPSAALAPEDLTETEWFYLMCASYCFPPGVGLPGKAFAMRGHVWLSGANEVDSKVFSRAILAKSAGIQTVACIPAVDGVLEIGTTEKDKEDIGLIQYARSIFMDQHLHGIHMMPTLSGHSTSNPITNINHQPFDIKREQYVGGTNVKPNNPNPEDEHNEMEDDYDDEIDTACALGSEANTEKNSCLHRLQNNMSSEQDMPNAGSSELMQVEMSERVRDGCSNNMDEEVQILMVCPNSDLPGQDEFDPWHCRYEDLCSKYLQSSAAEDQAAPTENDHYTETVLTILRKNARRQTQTASNIKAYLAVSNNSSFSRWNPKRTDDLQSMMVSGGTPQRMLKSILYDVPSRYRGEAQSLEPRDDEGASRSQRGQVQAELSASHVLKERRRREKLNERFIVLRSLVPFVTKMDRASILGDTIEYVKQLRRRIQDLESRAPQTTQPRAASTQKNRAHRSTGADYLTPASAGKRAVEESGSCCSSSTGVPAVAAPGTEVQVSIIESDALLELRCPHREGLLLRVMQALHRELRLDVISVQASSAGDVLLAELRAKVKEVHGRRSSITEVKRSIHQILSSD
ncbi:transcription factor BHLH42-like [Phragmites australis]|uniref:transcription factor BHLH42-like n=1 Tax=Phragmites australis TaxID=29695 RepID=UPI002D782C54|nr:transcription factor BHLH42-like [Phragmites australis]